MIALSRQRAALLVIDVQDRLFGAMPAEIQPQLVRNTVLLIEAAKRLELPVVATQQYPKGLGQTVPAIAEALGDGAHRFDKTVFSAAATPELAALARRPDRDQWIVVGIEAHVCVYQTVRDLVARGHQVHVPTDAIASRTKANWRVGCALLERAGGVPSSTEACVFDLLGCAGTDEFKALSKLIR